MIWLWLETYFLHTWGTFHLALRCQVISLHVLMRFMSAPIISPQVAAHKCDQWMDDGYHQGLLRNKWELHVTMLTQCTTWTLITSDSITCIPYIIQSYVYNESIDNCPRQYHTLQCVDIPYMSPIRPEISKELEISILCPFNLAVS